jgi:hypothetical protein
MTLILTITLILTHNITLTLNLNLTLNLTLTLNLILKSPLNFSPSLKKTNQQIKCPVRPGLYFVCLSKLSLCQDLKNASKKTLFDQS